MCVYPFQNACIHFKNACIHFKMRVSILKTRADFMERVSNAPMHILFCTLYARNKDTRVKNKSKWIHAFWNGYTHF
jgi:hypothetical protein